MFDIIGVVLAVLKLVNFFLDRADHEAAKQDGRNEAVLEQTMAIAAKVADKKRIQEQVDAMSDKEVADALRDLEPRDPKHL